MAQVSIFIDRGEKFPDMTLTAEFMIEDDQIVTAHDTIQAVKALAIASENLLHPTLHVQRS